MRTHRKTASLGGQIALSAAQKNFQWWIPSSGCLSRGHGHLTRLSCFPETCRCERKSSWEERAYVHTCLCARPSFTGRGENHRRIDFFQTNYHCFDTRRWYTHLPTRSSFPPVTGDTTCISVPYAWYTGIQRKNTHLPTQTLEHNQHSHMYANRSHI